MLAHLAFSACASHTQRLQRRGKACPYVPRNVRHCQNRLHSCDIISDGDLLIQFAVDFDDCLACSEDAVRRDKRYAESGHIEPVLVRHYRVVNRVVSFAEIQRACVGQEWFGL